MWCSHSRLIDERALYSASTRQKPLHVAALAAKDRWLENRLYVTRSRPDITTRLPGARTRFTRGIQSYHTTGHHRDSLNYTKLG